MLKKSVVGLLAACFIFIGCEKTNPKSNAAPASASAPVSVPAPPREITSFNTSFGSLKGVPNLTVENSGALLNGIQCKVTVLYRDGSKSSVDYHWESWDHAERKLVTFSGTKQNIRAVGFTGTAMCGSEKVAMDWAVENNSITFNARVVRGWTGYSVSGIYLGDDDLSDVKAVFVIHYDTGKTFRSERFWASLKSGEERDVGAVPNQGQVESVVITGTAELDGKQRQFSTTVSGFSK
jgi:uncharacterized lipoprotein NlpE involved in copper resistance